MVSALGVGGERREPQPPFLKPANVRQELRRPDLRDARLRLVAEFLEEVSAPLEALDGLEVVALYEAAAAVEHEPLARVEEVSGAQESF